MPEPFNFSTRAATGGAAFHVIQKRRDLRRQG
jgi:hypothetical protein